jgi:hypothetical protein
LTGHRAAAAARGSGGTATRRAAAGARGRRRRRAAAAHGGARRWWWRAGQRRRRHHTGAGTNGSITIVGVTTKTGGGKCHGYDGPWHRVTMGLDQARAEYRRLLASGYYPW